MDNPLHINMNPNRCRTLITRECIKAMGLPKRIRFLINEEKKQIAIQACNEKEVLYHKVPKDLFNAGSCFEISSLSLIQKVWRLMGWDMQNVYQIGGQCIAEHHMIIFDLAGAEIINSTNDNG